MADDRGKDTVQPNIGDIIQPNRVPDPIQGDIKPIFPGVKITIEDLIGKTLNSCLETLSPVNQASPNPLDSRDLQRLCRALHRIHRNSVTTGNIREDDKEI